MFENREAEQVIREFIAKKNKENLIKLLNELGCAKVYTVPQMLMKNKKGEKLIPVFTSFEQVLEKRKPEELICIPFLECARSINEKKWEVDGIVVNPFTDNLLLYEAALSCYVQKEEPDTVALTPSQMHIFLRNRFELKELPWIFFHNPKEFTEMLAKEKTEAIFRLFKECYGVAEGFLSYFPYQKEDFEVLVLNINKRTTMIRVGMPSRNRANGQCVSLFFCYNKESGEGVCHRIKKGIDGAPNQLEEVTKEGDTVELGQAPKGGEELYQLLKRLPWEKEV